MTTLRKLIKSSLRKLNSIQIGEEPSYDDMDISLSALNSMIDSWSNNILTIHKMKPYYFPLKQSQETYKMGPAFDENGDATGADWVIERPMRVSKMNLLQYFSLNCPPSPSSSPCNLYQTVVDANTVDYFDFNSVDGAGKWVNGSTHASATVLANAFGTQIANGFCSSGMKSTQTGDALGYAILSNFSATSPTAVTYEMALFNPGNLEPTGDQFGTNIASFGVDETQNFIAHFRINQLGGIPDSQTFNLHVINQQINQDQSFNQPIHLLHNTWTDLALTIDAPNNILRVFVNGTIFIDTTLTDFFGEAVATLMAVSAIFDGSGIGVDEYRASTIVRHTSNYDIYQPTVPVPTGGCTIETTPASVRYPMKVLAFNEFGDIRIPKLSNSLPRYAYDDGDYPTRNIHIWPVPSEASKAIEVWLWQPLFTYDTLDDELNLPPGYERALTYNLCVELAPEFQKQIAPEIAKIATDSLAEIKRLNQTHPIRRPSSLLGNAQKDGIFNFITGDTLPSILR